MAKETRADLITANRSLRAQVATLRSENLSQAGVIAELEATIGELERKIALVKKRSKRDSSNSSMPPSSDHFTKKQKSPSPSRKARQALGREPGKQPGAPGAHLPHVEIPDFTEVHSPDRCSGCGGDLSDAEPSGLEVRQVTDIPAPRPVVTEHQALTKQCHCGASTKASFPPRARAFACYGPKLRAIALYLLSYQHLPVERCAFTLRDLFGVEVSTGFLDQLYTEAANGLEGFMAAVLALGCASEVVHVDETFDHVGKDKLWFHVACNELYTLLHADSTRGMKGTERLGLFPDFTGIAVHDRYAQYFHYDKATHAICGAHLIRDLASVALVAVQEGWTTEMTALLIEMKLAGDKAREAGETALTPALRRALFKRYDTIVADALALNFQPEGPKRDRLEKDAFNLAAALQKRKTDVLRFVTDLRVPFTNNRAEADIRMVKIHAKVSGPFRAMRGAERLAAVRSYLQTARKHGLLPFEVLSALFTGNVWIPKRT